MNEETARKIRERRAEIEALAEGEDYKASAVAKALLSQL